MFEVPAQPTEQRPPGAIVRIDVYSHHIQVSKFGRPVKDALLEYCKTIAQYGLKRIGLRKFVKAMIRVYVGVTKDREQFNFHRNQLEEIIVFLGRHGVYRKQIWVVEHELYTPPTIEFDYHDNRTPRAYQDPLIHYIVDEGVNKVITLDPGRGKTFIALRAISMLKHRTFFTIKAMYIEKWINDAKEGFNFKKHELMVIKGSSQLKTVIELALAGELDAKIILCSNMTFFQYLKTYEIYGNMVKDLGYHVTPNNFFETLGIGLAVIDEVHQDFHLNYRTHLYSHVPKTLCLSGTLESDDPFINKMYGVMFPESIRCHENERHVYLTVEALIYTMENADKRIKFINPGMKAYSHTRFEKSIMGQKPLLKKYMDMICDIVQNRYVNRVIGGHKMIVYCSTVKLCTLMANELKRRHPTMKVTRYVSEDEYEEMLTCDIIVSTLKSLGTAIDVPGLSHVLMTDNLGSRQANLQAAGRLRYMHDYPDLSPEFLYLVCTDIEKHREYHVKKMDIFNGRVKIHREIMTHYKL